MSFGGSGGGSSSIATSTDVALNNPGNGQVLAYNSSLSKWVNNATAVGPGQVALDSFTGANDDALLAAAMSYASAQTYKPAIMLTNRQYTFTQPVTPYDGFALIGTEPTHDQNRSGNVLGCVVKLTTNGAWLTWPSGTLIHNVTLSKLSFDCGSAATICTSGGARMWKMDDLSFQNGTSFLGNSTTNWTHDTCVFTGVWNVNNVSQTAFNIGGSDSRFSPTQLLVDSPGNQFMADTDFLVRLTSLNTTNIQNWYVTCDRHSGFLITGGTSMLPNRITHCDIQGRNATTPCFGALIRCTSDTIIADNEFAYAMSNPSATGRNDGGALHFYGGNSLVTNCSYKLASGVSASTPFIYVESGATVRVSNILGDGFIPVVAAQSGATVYADSSVTVVAV